VKHALHYEPSGRIVSANGVLFDHEAVPAPGCEVLLVDSRVDINRHYVKDGATVEMPERPSQHHVFDYEAEAWVLDDRAVRDDVRVRRAALLQASDWTQLPDVPLETRAAWADYRQALRDITEQPGFPDNIEWPVPPE